ncbi:hypothetical protein MRX96_012261 [Rhipicephalus microplus]
MYGRPGRRGRGRCHDRGSSLIARWPQQQRHSVLLNSVQGAAGRSLPWIDGAATAISGRATATHVGSFLLHAVAAAKGTTLARRDTPTERAHTFAAGLSSVRTAVRERVSEQYSARMGFFHCVPTLQFG